jgi:hypothetical protein
LARSASSDQEGELVPPGTGALEADSAAQHAAAVGPIAWQRIVELARQIQDHADEAGDLDREEMSLLAKLVLLFQARLMGTAGRVWPEEASVDLRIPLGDESSPEDGRSEDPK